MSWVSSGVFVGDDVSVPWRIECASDATGEATMVASDSWLNDLCRKSLVEIGGGEASLLPGVSSASSAISISLRRRREFEEEVIEPEAVCSRHAEDSALSVSSDGCERENTVSCGENLSRID